MFLILVPAIQTKRYGTLDAGLCKWLVRPVLVLQQFHCFWPRHSQFRHNKHSSSTTRFSLWQLPHLHLQFPIEILYFVLIAPKHIPAEKYLTHQYFGRCLHTKTHVKQFYHKDYDNKTLLLYSWHFSHYSTPIYWLVHLTMKLFPAKCHERATLRQLWRQTGNSSLFILYCYLDFISLLKKSSYKCTGCKEYSPQEVHWTLTTVFCGRSSSDSFVESVSELATLSYG